MSLPPSDMAERAALIAGLMDRPIFIAGRGRSGTSLLMRLFDGHPQVFSTPGETKVFTEIAPRLKTSRDAAAAAAALAERFAYPARTADAALEARIRALDPDDSRLGRALLQIGLERWSGKCDPAGAVAMLEKTPKNEEHLQAIFTAFPKARVLYLLRDPRGVHVSNSRSPTFRLDAGETARQWVRSVRLLTPYVGTSDAPCPIRVVRFEQLVTEPQSVMAGLCAFLGLDWSNALTAPTVLGRPWAGNAYDPDKLTPDGVAALKADEWRAELSAADSAAIAAVAGFEMSLLGYRT